MCRSPTSGPCSPASGPGCARAATSWRSWARAGGPGPNATSGPTCSGTTRTPRPTFAGSKRRGSCPSGTVSSPKGTAGTASSSPEPARRRRARAPAVPFVLVGGPGADDHGGVQPAGAGDSRDQPAAGDGLDRLRRLPLARLEQQVTALSQPARGRGGHAPQHVKPVSAAVERHPRLVVARLRGQQPDLLGGDVGNVGGQDVDVAPQPGRQRLIQVTQVHLATGGGDV